MLQECIDVFKYQLSQPNGKTLILDQYVPKDGTYYMITIKKDGTFVLGDPLEIYYNKKNKEIEGSFDGRYEYMKFLDYHSKLLEMNKPMDPKKQIHSNNYMTFFVKKDALKNGKVTESIIEGYYKILENPTLKYKTGKAKIIFEKTIEMLTPINQDVLLKIKDWILQVDWKQLSSLDKKDYLKLFFVFEDEVQTRNLYEEEGRRYLLPNIFNSNDFNVEVDGEVWGLPNNNLSMNGKKPFLGHLSRNQKVPCLLSQKEAMIRMQFFDYLMALASVGKRNIYVDFENHTIVGYQNGQSPGSINKGCFLYVVNAKELEIHRIEPVVYFHKNMKNPFVYTNYFGLKEGEVLKSDVIHTIDDLEKKINQIFFDWKLMNNYFTKAADISIHDAVLKHSILIARDRLFTYTHTNQSIKIYDMMQKVMWGLIKNNLVSNGNEFEKKKKLREQINLYWALLHYWNDKKEEIQMSDIRQSIREKINNKEDWSFASKEEYYYTAGQVIAYLFSLSKAKSIPASEINPFLNIKSQEQFLERLLRVYKKYNYSFEMKNRFQRTFARLQQVQEGWDLDKIWLIAGFADDNLFYEKSNTSTNGNTNQREKESEDDE